MGWLTILYIVSLKLTIFGLIAANIRLRKGNAKEGPIGYLCRTDFEYELDPEISDGNVVVYNTLESCQDGIGPIHADECGVIKVRLVKLEDTVKGEIYGEKLKHRSGSLV